MEKDMKKLIYIASPYTKGDVAVNVRKSFEAANDLAALGYLPYPPLHIHFWHFLFPHPYEFWTDMDMEWVMRSDAVLRLPGESSGADKEVTFAMDCHIPVFHSIQELVNNMAA